MTGDPEPADLSGLRGKGGNVAGSQRGEKCSSSSRVDRVLKKWGMTNPRWVCVGPSTKVGRDFKEEKGE